MFTMSPNWKLKNLVFAHLIICFLLVSWIFPLSRHIWDFVDRSTFFFLNSWIKESAFWQNFWAIANHKRTDWLHDLLMLSFFFYYIKKGSHGQRIWRICELLLSIALFFFTILLINKTLAPNVFHVSRNSPSIIFENSHRLSKMVDWIYIKDYSRCSFPADHGTTACLFVITTFLLMGKRVGWVALPYGIFFCLPRLVVGAHFVTDILIGSLSIAIFSISWAYCTPLFFRSVCFLQKLFRRRIHENPT